jgi:hypothetical protein
MLENLTIKEVREILNLFGGNKINNDNLENKEIDKYWIGKKVIVRTYSAGVFFGEIELKANDEIILKNARRLYYWKTKNNGISLSEVANDGLDNISKVCQKVSHIYLKAIELIECSYEAIKNIEGQDDYKA